jgi:cytoskeletal protein CcmA (bactofilin family)
MNEPAAAGAMIAHRAFVVLSRVPHGVWWKGRHMSATLDNKPEENKLYVGVGVTVKGAVQVPDHVVVDGVLEGDIAVDSLLVREQGTIKGHVSVARNAEIFGTVRERLDVKGLLILRASSRVEGTISCGTLIIERGASITGGISATERGAARETKPEKGQAVRASNGVAVRKRLDMTALEMPSPIAANA